MPCGKCLPPPPAPRPRGLCYQTGTQIGALRERSASGPALIVHCRFAAGALPLIWNHSGRPSTDLPPPPPLLLPAVWGVNSASPHFSRLEFHSSSLKLAESIKVKDLFAQHISGKFTRGHFSDKSESFSKVTKPRGGSAKRFSVCAHLRGLLFFLPLGNRNPEGGHQQHP